MLHHLTAPAILLRCVYRDKRFRLGAAVLQIICQGFLPTSRLHKFGRQQVLSGHSGAICALTFTPSGTQLLSAGQVSLVLRPPYHCRNLR